MSAFRRWSRRALAVLLAVTVTVATALPATAALPVTLLM